MSCSLYILESDQNGRYYVGISSDPERRLTHHNSISTGFTARYRPWSLVFTETFSTKQKAREAEQLIKDWKSRKMTRYVIDGTIDLHARLSRGE